MKSENANRIGGGIFMKKIMRFVCCCFLSIILATSVAMAADEEIFWCRVENDSTVIFQSGISPYAEYFVFDLLRDGEDWYLKYKTGDAILLNDFDLQCRHHSVGLNSSEWIWYVSSNAMKRAQDAYDVKVQENSYYESELILIENSGTTFKLEDNSIYILKAEYQAEKLVSNEVDFGIAVIFEGEEIPKFWINLSKDECNIENSDKGIQIFVSKLAIERAIKSYQDFSRFY